MSATIAQREAVIKLLKRVSQIHRREMWALSGVWALSCLGSGLIGALYGLQALEILFGVFAVFSAGMFLWNWAYRTVSKHRSSNA
jgi:hypothetical protein